MLSELFSISASDEGCHPQKGGVSMGEVEVRGRGLGVMLKFRTVEMEKQTKEQWVL